MTSLVSFCLRKKRATALLLLLLSNAPMQAQSDSTRLPAEKIFGFCLDANVKSALPLLKTEPGKKLPAKQEAFRTEMELRFGGKKDKSGFLEKHASNIDPLLTIFQTYWRKSLLDPEHSADSKLRSELSAFFKSNFHLSTKNILPDDTLDRYLKLYVKQAGYFTTGFGQTGKLLDLLVWKKQQDTLYTFTVFEEQIRTPVVFMTEFVTLGWEEYATLGKAYPGGWATPEALFCVKESYDLPSENFRISYLCHEGRHFSDYQQFPKLKSADLEYRAKLTELSLLDADLYQVLAFFINNANGDSENAHSFADYCVVRDLSRKLFGVDFESDLSKWKAIGNEKIHAASHELLLENTKQLQTQGKDVETWIKK